MNISSDVNTIFAYGDDLHPFHNSVCLFMAKKIRVKYILLSKVKSHFIYTYKDYLTTSCTIIDQAVRDYRKKLSKSPSKSYKPSSLAISANVDKLIETHLENMSNMMDFNTRGVKKFISLLLSDYSIPTLLEKDKALGEFREKYLIEAEERALEILNKFIKFFRTREFEVMNIEHYENYDKWFDKVKNSKFNGFKNGKDREDMIIAAELLSYNQEFGLLGFFTCDKDFTLSILKVSKEFSQKIGKVHLINKNYKPNKN